MDLTPPEPRQAPTFTLPSTAAGQYDRSLVRVTWTFVDPQSPVVSTSVMVSVMVTGLLDIANKYLLYYILQKSCLSVCFELWMARVNKPNFSFSLENSDLEHETK